ncbi:MAG: hypothetical protein WC319_01750 [Candidatus Paceibacterota bacterium]
MKLPKKIAGGKIAALLQAFGRVVGLCGLANVLQCVIAKTPSAKKCGGVKI